MKLNVRNLLTLGIVVVTVLFIVGAGVDAGKSRKRHRHRSKRTHDEKPHRHEKKKGRKNMKADMVHEHTKTVSLIEVVESQYHNEKVEKSVPNDHNPHIMKTPKSYIDEYLEEKRRSAEQKKIPQDDTTVLPVVKTKLDFFLRRQESEYFYEPPTTTTIRGFTSSELGLVSVHSAKGKYGLHSNAESIFGQLIHISDAGRTNSHFGCGNAIANLEEIKKAKGPWIALIERGHCSFFTKIRLAERNNASAVIIYNNQHGEVPKINTIGTKIVSVIIPMHDGHHVSKLTDSGTKVLVNIAVDLSPDIATVPEITTVSATFNMQKAVQDPPGGGASSSSGFSFLTTFMIALLATFFQLVATS